MGVLREMQRGAPEDIPPIRVGPGVEENPNDLCVVLHRRKAVTRRREVQGRHLVFVLCVRVGSGVYAASDSCW